MNILLEALLVGIVTLICGVIVDFLLSKVNFKNKYILFVILGFSTHLFFEYLGLNKVYCQYGNACIKN